MYTVDSYWAKSPTPPQGTEMKIRYVINSSWTRDQIVLAIDVIAFTLEYYGLHEGGLTVILSNSGELEGSAERTRSKRYEIRVKHTSCEKELIKAIAHEMTHISQFYKGELRSDGTKHTWKGKEWLDKNYWLYPWEMTARAMEDPIYYEFMEKHG